VYDLIIIGGGMSGISAGHFFRNQNILILEKIELLSGASSKNAGFIISGFGEHYQRTVQRLGHERARRVHQIHLKSHLRIGELTNTLECSYQKTGSYAVALNQKESDALRQSFNLMKADGYPVEWVPVAPAGLREKRPAVFNQDDAHFDSALFWTKPADGIPVQTHCEVVGVIEDGDTNIVRTTTHEYRTRHVIYCLNAYSSLLLPELDGRFIALRGQMLELPINGRAPCTLPVYGDYGDVYWRFTDNSLIFGGLEQHVPEDEAGIAEQVSERITEQQINWIQEHFEAGTIVDSPGRTCCGTMAFTVDGFPFVGPLRRRNQYVLAGLCGLGHSYALECASWIHELLTTGRNIIPPDFSSDRIEKLAHYRGGNWRTLYEAWNH